MDHRSTPSPATIGLLAGCWVLLGVAVVGAQPRQDSGAAEDVADAATSSTTADRAGASSVPAVSLGDVPAAASSAVAGSQAAAPIDTWGTAAAANLGGDSPASATTPADAETPSASSPPEHRSTSESDEAGHVRYQLERIEVRGNERTGSSVVLRYLPFREGKELDVDDAEFTLARYRLLGTGFFREVEFSLRKGSRRGSVVLLVDVVERNTFVFNGFWMGLSKDADTKGEKRTLTAFGGVDFAETNLFGTGFTLGGAIGVARDQYALRANFLDPAVLGTPWMFSTTILYNKALDFFGTSDVQWGPRADDANGETTRYAVVQYKRFGGSVGVGRDLSLSTQLWFHYRLETISANRPAYAQQIRGGRLEPITFDIEQGRSVFSTVRANFQLDTRDHPFLPTRGWFLTTWGELGLLPLGSDYEYQRFEVSASYWWHKNNSPHVFRLQLFGGGMTGNVPFFEQYYVGDFSELLPARMLSLNVDRRPCPDYFRTAIAEVRYGQYAAQIAGEYRYPVYRGHRSVFGIDFFLRAGLFSVAHRRDLVDPAPNYHGLSRIPLALSYNAGFRMDTSAGGLVFSFSNVLGFLPGADAGNGGK